MAKYYIIAGEASGDLHGSNLMKGLFAQDPSCDIRFWGGDAMSAVGGTVVRHYRDTAVMGIVEVAAKLPKILKNLSFCKRDIAAFCPDAVILIDYPGFNMKIARFAKRRGFRVFYYIPPKVWARGENRIAKLKKYVDEVFIIFPFESEYFKSRGINARYYGNPLLDSLKLRRQESVREKDFSIALLAGSRKAELKFLMPRFVALEKLIERDPRYKGCTLTVAGAPSLSCEDYSRFLPESSCLKLEFGKTRELLEDAAAAVISSGTASLEAALIGTPQVVCYGFNRLTYMIAKRLVHVPFISLANLIENKAIFRELLQDDASALNIKAELDRLLFDEKCREKFAVDYAALRSDLGGEGASDRVAAAIVSTISK